MYIVTHVDGQPDGICVRAQNVDASPQLITFLMANLGMDIKATIALSVPTELHERCHTLIETFLDYQDEMEAFLRPSLRVVRDETERG